MTSLTEANRNAFNDLAASYNSRPGFRELRQKIDQGLQQRLTWLGAAWLDPNNPQDDARDVRLLDYACGTGAITQALGPYVRTIRGVDLSEKMVEAYNEAAKASGLSPTQANAVVGDLVADASSILPEELQGAEYRDFDVAAVGLGFHHFEDPGLAVKKLVERLKPGSGVLLIIDLLPWDHEKAEALEGSAPSMPDMRHTIHRTGFTREEMERMFVDAGLDEFGYDETKEKTQVQTHEGMRAVTTFFAKGRRVGRD